MAWQIPKTNWSSADGVRDTDMNRIEGNALELKNTKADATALTTHTDNADIHVTALQKTAWSDKYNKPSAGIPKNDLASDVQASLNAVADKSNKPTTVTATMSASGWSNGTYSFESSYPSATYDISIELNGDSATSDQIDAWSAAKIVGSATANKCYAKGDIPTVNIPIIVKVVVK